MNEAYYLFTVHHSANNFIHQEDLNLKKHKYKLLEESGEIGI